ncbi:MAG: 2-oxo acid dehydrogenase subunit E2 [Saprospiraceae bacterium]|nr:2-oxo acid dehydrogenase subunit E2 [Saprospiraceae bacterium]
MADFRLKYFPKTRIATNDICAIGIRKHHIAAMIEIDVSGSREKIKQLKNSNARISLTAWLIKVISLTIKEYENVAAYLAGKRKVVIFKDINVSIIVEKDINGHKVPIPLIIEKANERSIESIFDQIAAAREHQLTDKDIVLHNKSKKLERFYYILPGFIRRLFWQYLLTHPHFAYSKMGNVAITSVGMLGKANGWFIPISVHPVCFGIGNISKKPVVVNDEIVIREMVNISILLDHDVVDGGQMARFISDLSGNIENGIAL